MSIWLICKAVLLAVIVLLTIPFAICLFLAIWGKSFALVLDRDCWLVRIKRPLVRRMITRFLV